MTSSGVRRPKTGAFAWETQAKGAKGLSVQADNSEKGVSGQAPASRSRSCTRRPMHEALHPNHDYKVDVSAYLRDFGRLPLGHKGPESRRPPRCPFCGQDLSVIGDKNGQSTTGHFAHKPRSDFCPSKVPAGKPYLDLRPRRPDLLASLNLRTEFKATWQQQLKQLEDMVACLDHREFLGLLALADKWRIWEYANLHVGQVPFVLVALADFSPVTGRHDREGAPLRKLWLRFFYDSELRRLEDLWIRPTTPPALFRVSYLPKPRGGIPDSKNLLRSTPVEISAKFLTRPVAPPTPPWLVDKVEDWLSKNWADIA